MHEASARIETAARAAARAAVLLYERLDTPLLRRRLLLALAAAGAMLLLLSELMAVREVHAITVVLRRVSGGDMHSWLFVPLALVVAAMAWGAYARGRRPAMFALIALGVLAIVIGLGIDLPRLGDTSGLSERYSDAQGSAGAGFYLELIGGLLAAISGTLQLRLSNRASE